MYLTIDEAAILLCAKPRDVRKHIADGRLPAVYPMGKARIPLRALPIGEKTRADAASALLSGIPAAKRAKIEDYFAAPQIPLEALDRAVEAAYDLLAHERDVPVSAADVRAALAIALSTLVESVR